MVSDTDGFLQQEYEVRGRPSAAVSLLAYELAEWSEDAAHVRLEVVDYSSQSIAIGDLISPERGPGAFPRHDIGVEGQRDEQQAGHVIIPCSRNWPVKDLRLDGIGEGLLLLALSGAVHHIAAFGA